METKLLSKLRKKAKERFHLLPFGTNINKVIIEENNGLWVTYYDNISGERGYELREAADEPMTFEVGLKDLKRRRRNYILREVRSLRETHRKGDYYKKCHDAEMILRKY